MQKIIKNILKIKKFKHDKNFNKSNYQKKKINK